MNTLPRFTAIDKASIETAIRAEPHTIGYLLSEQDRADITFNDELREIMRNIIIAGFLALLFIIV